MTGICKIDHVIQFQLNFDYIYDASEDIVVRMSVSKTIKLYEKSDLYSIILWIVENVKNLKERDEVESLLECFVSIKHITK